MASGGIPDDDAELQLDWAERADMIDACRKFFDQKSQPDAFARLPKKAQAYVRPFAEATTEAQKIEFVRGHLALAQARHTRAVEKGLRHMIADAERFGGRKGLFGIIAVCFGVLALVEVLVSLPPPVIAVTILVGLISSIEDVFGVVRFLLGP